MSSRYPQIHIENVTTIAIGGRQNKVRPEDVARLPHGDFSIANFVQSLPRQLIGNDLRRFVDLVRAARANGKPIIWMMGAHIIKVGLSPLIIELMKKGFATTLAMNGAGIIHDSELASGVGTSEDVERNIADGTFGMARETGDFINGCALIARQEELGLGETVGRELLQRYSEARGVSLFANAFDLGRPATVHVAIGTDIVHQQPTADGAAIGDASYRDFKILAAVIANLGEGGVVINAGSNVLLPEVFLKALTVARNLGHSVKNFTTANFDMIQHYRPRVNVVQRPVAAGGQGFAFTGHHELMIPLLAWILLNEQ